MVVSSVAVEHVEREATRLLEQRVVGVCGPDEMSEAPAHVDVALAQNRHLALYERNRFAGVVRQVQIGEQHRMAAEEIGVLAQVAHYGVFIARVNDHGFCFHTSMRPS